ncbi:MAG TPA: ABC transporter permease [Candidatus Saccharibacteria bacterium]|nr:ABC transporter permease [Candidatus Saccharibacteria bacterium]HRK94042.1 ABC transporter permease [Candidatus Saccharibacteria bacterium]
MPLLLAEHYRTARQSLDRARLRTLLTITGVAIGVASITAVLALSDGVNRVIHRQVSALGDTIAVVRPSSAQVSLADLSNPTPRNAYSTSPLSERDVEAISSLPSTSEVAPLMTLSGSVRTTSTTPAESSILATTPNLESISDLKIAEGQFIDSVTRQNTAVVGAQLSVNLFGTEQSIGQNFFIRGQSFTVIGILKRQNNPINYNNIDFDHTAIISLESGKLFNGGVAQIQQINVKAQPGTDMADFGRTIDQELRGLHDGQADAEVFTGREIAQPTSQLFRFVSLVMAIIASISLVVGGIGIMNIMLVGVSERTREIGLRKAVGASNMMIVSQFLVESLIISSLGGLLGFIGGYFLAFTASLFIPYDPAFTWSVVGWAAALSVGVGVIFGLYPAIRAARKDPIESLRRYH